MGISDRYPPVKRNLPHLPPLRGRIWCSFSVTVHPLTTALLLPTHKLALPPETVHSDPLERKKKDLFPVSTKQIICLPDQVEGVKRASGRQIKNQAGVLVPSGGQFQTQNQTL